MTRLQGLALKTLLAGGILAGLSVSCASSEKTQGLAAQQESFERSEPKVAQILRSMCDRLDRAKAMRFRVSAAMDREVETGQMAQFHRTSEITILRPNRLYSRTKSDDGNWCVWQKGNVLTLLDVDANTYATHKGPGTIAGMLDEIVHEFDIVMPMADLVAGRTYEALAGNVESAEYVGIREMGGVQCHQLLFHQETIDWQIWIQVEGPPLPRKMVITYITEPNEPQYVATLDDWNLAPGVSDSLFTFKAPAESKSIEMVELVQQNEEQ